MDDKDLLLDILHDILGDEKKHYESHCQISYNCPECDDGRNKGNLEVNYENHIFKCWSCGDSNNMHGTLTKLIKKYGNRQQLKIYNVLSPEDHKPKIKQKTTLKLPDGFTLFKESNPRYPVYKQAYNYLKNRGITDEMIEKFGIGFCGEGSHAGRIVIPSYNKKGHLNYYIARSWYPNTKAKYKNPDSPKDEIIFWENLINWDEDIYLVEGAFDGVFLPNPIPMLGKHLSKLLFDTLYENANENIIICVDGDAWEDGLEMYHTLNGGRLYGKIKIVKLPKDKDVCDLRGNIDEYYYKVR
jgi:DNA primase